MGWGGICGCRLFRAGEAGAFRAKGQAGQEKGGDPGAAGLWNRGLEGCPQTTRAFGTRIWGCPCLRPLRAPHQSHLSNVQIGVFLELERKQVSVLALSFREPRDRVPCIDPSCY